MSTFFDKLSGAMPQGNEINLAANRAASRLSRREEPVRAEPAEEEEEEPTPIHTTVAQEPKTALRESQEEPSAEEEGELTVDIYNKGDVIVIQSTVAGVKPEHLDVGITDDMVTIRGRRERADRVKEEHYYYKELFWGTFSRQIILPEEIEQEEAEASLQHGLLTVKLPKKRHGVTQKLKVKVV